MTKTCEHVNSAPVYLRRKARGAGQVVVIGRLCLECYRIAGPMGEWTELEEHGFAPVEEEQDSFIQGTEDAKRFCAVALRLIDSGFKVAVDYESTAIGGLEGYVSLYAKKGED